MELSELYTWAFLSEVIEHMREREKEFSMEIQASEYFARLRNKGNVRNDKNFPYKHRG